MPNQRCLPQAVPGLFLLIVFHCTTALSPAVNGEMQFPQLSSMHLVQTDSLVRPGATLRMISDQFSFTEGPAADQAGNVYFTDQPNNRIWKYDTDGKLSIFMENAGRSNGMYFDKDGNLITCADEQNQLWKIGRNGEITVLLKDLDGKYFNGPNDLWISPRGLIYFTDPLYRRKYWEGDREHIAGEKVYVLSPGSNKPQVVDDQIKKPNGIIGSPDGNTLYVADIGDNKTYRYTINSDGSLSERTLFVNQGSDGMTMDTKGNVYLTGKGVTVYDPTGKLIKQIDVPANWTANVCFGGPQHNKLIITASQYLFELDMNVHGAR